jgi:hypothetical protein
MSDSCPRPGCDNRLGKGAPVVCLGDFVALANMCRGKKRLGQPLADQIAADNGSISYGCPVCKAYHNGRRPALLDAQTRAAAGTVAAMRADPRVGWRGVLLLADAWAPERSPRTQWYVGLDQTEAFDVPF